MVVKPRLDRDLSSYEIPSGSVLKAFSSVGLDLIFDNFKMEDACLFTCAHEYVILNREVSLNLWLHVGLLRKTVIIEVLLHTAAEGKTSDWSIFAGKPPMINQ